MVIETTIFLVDDDAAFAEADARYQQEVAYQQPGLLRRTTARADDGEWIVITIWDGDPPPAPSVPDGARDPQTRRYTTLD